MRIQISLPSVILLGTCLALGAPEASAQFVLADDAGTHNLGGDDGEITPNGLYGIVRETTSKTRARFYDMATGALITTVMGASLDPFHLTGVAQDAVVCTDTRAATLGTSLMIFDLTLLPASPLLTEYDLGRRPRDFEITPDGSLLVVRGGAPGPFAPGGLFIFELAAGQQVATAPGLPPEYPSQRHSFDVDSVAVTNDHAVCTSIVYAAQRIYTRVTIWDLHPAGGGSPVVAYETDRTSGTDQVGGPHDLMISPDGTHCAVRSELGVACYALSGATSSQLWQSNLAGDPGPFGNSALDSIEVTDTRIATISRVSNPLYPIGAQVDVFDMAGNHGYERVFGDPHDLTIDDTGASLLVRTHRGIFLYDIAGWTPGSSLQMQDSASPVWGSHTSWGAGMDSIATSGTRVVSLFRDGAFTEVYVHDFAGGVLTEVGHHTMDDMPTDLAMTPSGERCVVSGLAQVDVIDVHTGIASLVHDLGSGWWPWCDGVVVNENHALAFGVIQPNWGGWVSVIDLFNQPTNYCSAGPNSVGPGAHIYANGSASIVSNDLKLWATDLPNSTPGQFFYGPNAISTPLGNGTLCVGNPARFGPIMISQQGSAVQAVDYGNLPAGGGAIQAGTTHRFQFIYRDPAGGGAGFNLTEGLEILFGV